MDKYVADKSSSIMDCLKKIDLNENGFLVILSESRPLGVITDGDLRRALISGVNLTDNIISVMKEKFYFLSEDQSFFEIAECFNLRKIDFLPIVNSQGKIVDIITKNEFNRAVLLNLPLDQESRLNVDIEKETDHEIVPKPWGYYKTTLLTSFYQSKILCLNPKQSLSLQSHKHREEHWVNIKGRGSVVIGDSTKEFKPGDYVFIPKGCKHRITNDSDEEDLIVNEVQLGASFDEEDIVRYEDSYGRQNES